MEIRTTFRLGRDDLARVESLTQAFSLVGGNAGSSRKAINAKRAGEPVEQIDEDARLFGRISTGELTMEDARDAVQVIMRRAMELSVKKDVFTDQKTNDTFHDGVKANALKAVQMAQDFMANLLADISAHHEAA